MKQRSPPKRIPSFTHLSVAQQCHTPVLVDASVRIWVDVDAADYDHRDADDGGCGPDGCMPENT